MDLTCYNKFVITYHPPEVYTLCQIFCVNKQDVCKQSPQKGAVTQAAAAEHAH